MASYMRQMVDISLKCNVLSPFKSSLIQCVRFRKPIWVPVSKSKEFYVRKPTPIDPEEYVELEDRYRKYRADVESIRHFLKKQLAQKAVNITEQQRTDDAADQLWMKEQVEEWNRSVAQTRTERQMTEEREEQERLQLLMQKRGEKRLQEAMEAESIMQRYKAASAEFITRERLDEAIEEMLDSRSDYNFAITKSGEILAGEYPDRSKDAGLSMSKEQNPT